MSPVSTAQKSLCGPLELAGDKASSESAILHAVGVIERDYHMPLSTIVFLQATSPLRKPGDIDRAVELFLQRGCRFADLGNQSR